RLRAAPSGAAYRADRRPVWYPVGWYLARPRRRRPLRLAAPDDPADDLHEHRTVGVRRGGTRAVRAAGRSAARARAGEVGYLAGVPRLGRRRLPVLVAAALAVPAAGRPVDRPADRA